MISCSEQDNPETKVKDKKDSVQVLTQEQKDSIRCQELIAANDTFPKVNYRTEYIDDYDEFLDIKNKFKFSKENKWANKAFITLNRKEFRYVRIGDTVIIPDKIIPDMRAYSVYPQYYCGADSIPKLIMVSNKFQCYAAYEYGKLVRFAAANTGKEKTPTFPGRYALVWKDRIRKSSLDSNWVLPYTWNFHKYAGNAFHQFDMPGRAVSHSCVRQFMSDAKWLFSWGKGVRVDSNGKQIWMSGTPVIIQDIFDYDRKYGPWVNLENNKDFRIKVPENPMEVEEVYIPLKQIPEVVRNWLPNRKKYEVAEDTLRARGIIAEDVRLTPSINFNKLRREKEKKRRQDSIKRAKSEKYIQPEKDKTNIDLIRENLKKLEEETQIKKDSTEKK